ncbi:MAG: helix-turn-helix transcriptional regulator [Thermoplasmata archaeon]|nr:helix-turn-helix transcriptional regulator [Thermoplasmata archaeon]
MIDDNSADAYRKAFNTDRINVLRYRVYETIRDNPGLMDEEIAQKLGSPINSITGRVKELHDVGLIEFDNGKNGRNNTCRRSYIKGTMEASA